jgi:hypothetical protein
LVFLARADSLVVTKTFAEKNGFEVESGNLRLLAPEP